MGRQTQPTRRATVAEGIALRHSRRCASRHGEACSCRPSYQAQAWVARDDKPIRRTFPTLAAARAWRQRTQVAIRRLEVGAPSTILVSEAAAAWLEAARAGTIRTRSGTVYKPATIRTYEVAIRRHILPSLGSRRLSALSRASLQDYVEKLIAKGLAASSVHNAIIPVRAICRRAVSKGELWANPTLGLSLPASNGRRDRVAPPKEIDALLAALPAGDRPLWATAVYAGLRRGELQALRWQAIDLRTGVITVEHAWDREAGLIAPKSRSALRRVPLSGTLRRHLIAHRLRCGARPRDFVFSATGERPFDPATISRRAKRAWHSAGLSPISMHECRHTFASLMIAAGVNSKALSSYLGHASISITLDRYGHLMPGNEREAGLLLDSFLERSAASSAHLTAARGRRQNRVE